ncbi:hypothetical protein Y788_20925 [Pantoea dispersa 625]|nr:hypothetical protein Y788_20925 [Pantoea dispersa 625]
MLTGVRSVEFSKVSWCEFDLVNDLWEIAKWRMNKHNSHLVSLSSQVVEIFIRMKIIAGEYLLIFPGRNDVKKLISDARINKLINTGWH